jgi:hypothetical protein
MTTKESGKNLSGRQIPFSMRNGLLPVSTAQLPLRDLPTAEEPLPPALETDRANLVRVSDTRITKVNQETTDDN